MATTNAARIANDSPFCESRQDMKKLEDLLSNDAAMHAPLHEIERMLETYGREMLRAMMQAYFDLRSAQERRVDVHDADGVELVPAERALDMIGERQPRRRRGRAESGGGVDVRRSGAGAGRGAGGAVLHRAALRPCRGL
jgi:hypothetical protein